MKDKINSLKKSFKNIKIMQFNNKFRNNVLRTIDNLLNETKLLIF